MIIGIMHLLKVEKDYLGVCFQIIMEIIVVLIVYMHTEPNHH